MRAHTFMCARSVVGWAGTDAHNAGAWRGVHRRRTHAAQALPPLLPATRRRLGVVDTRRGAGRRAPRNCHTMRRLEYACWVRTGAAGGWCEESRRGCAAQAQRMARAGELHLKPCRRRISSGGAAQRPRRGARHNKWRLRSRVRNDTETSILPISRKCQVRSKI